MLLFNIKNIVFFYQQCYTIDISVAAILIGRYTPLFYKQIYLNVNFPGGLRRLHERHVFRRPIRIGCGRRSGCRSGCGCDAAAAAVPHGAAAASGRTRASIALPGCVDGAKAAWDAAAPFEGRLMLVLVFSLFIGF